MSAPWDTAALLMLCGLLAWRLASVLLRALALLCLWAGLAEIATGIGPVAGVGAVMLGAAAWVSGRWLEGRLRAPLAELFAMRRGSRRGR